MKDLRASLFVPACFILCASFGRATEDPLMLESGLISGIVSEDSPTVTVYKGIPYAAPPVGNQRWRAPQPAKHWGGVKAAQTFGPQCVCRNLGSAPIAGVSEDCLYLNVWAPARARAERLPVLVWIHGGGFQAGSGSEPSVDGTMFAKQRVVVVTFNYRVGVFGFLAHPELTKESESGASGNYGLLDQMAAPELGETQHCGLRWRSEPGHDRR